MFPYNVQIDQKFINSKLKFIKSKLNEIDCNQLSNRPFPCALHHNDRASSVSVSNVCASTGLQSPPTHQPANTMIANDQRRTSAVRAVFKFPGHKFTRRKAGNSSIATSPRTSGLFRTATLRRPLLFVAVFLFHILSNQLVNTFQFLDDPGNLPFLTGASLCLLNVYFWNSCW